MIGMSPYVTSNLHRTVLSASRVVDALVWV